VTETQSTFRLMYRSRNRIPENDRKIELGTLFSTARRNNKRAGLTGALLLTGDWFVQVLEGDEPTVRALYDIISQDPRHDSVTLLDTVEVGDRVFARWSMAKVAEGGEPDIPLIAHEDGIAPAAGRGTTPAQHKLLGTMRAAAGAAVV
jgi:Sensors of blue-light using FAD